MPVTSFSYSIPYLIFAAFLMVLMFLEFRYLKFGRDTKYIRWATMVGFLFFFGLRGFLYTDWQMYFPMFEKLPTLWGGDLLSAFSGDVADSFSTDVNTGKSGIEFGFILFNVFLKSIFPNYFVWVFVNVVIDVVLLDLFFRRYSPYYVLSFILFVAFGGCILEINLMRNIKAILLFLISIRFLEERRMIPYLLLNVLGVFFHTSALIFLPLYFFIHKVWPKWLLWSIFGVGLIVMIFQIGFLQPVLLSVADVVGGRLSVLIKLYLASDMYNQVYSLGLGFVERTLTFIILVVFQNKLIERNPRNVLFINAYVLYFIIFFYFTEVMIVIDRLSLLFVFSYWIIYPELLALVKDLYHKWMLMGLMVLYSCLKMVTMNSNVFSKYDNVLFGIESFDARLQRIQNNLDDLVGPK